MISFFLNLSKASTPAVTQQTTAESLNTAEEPTTKEKPIKIKEPTTAPKPTANWTLGEPLIFMPTTTHTSTLSEGSTATKAPGTAKEPGYTIVL